MIKITKFDAAEHLRSPKEISAYLAAAFETGDQDTINAAIGTAAKARGMADLAKQTGIGREQLYKAFRKGGNPTMKTLFKVLSAFEVTLTASAEVTKTVAAKKNAPAKKRAAPKKTVAKKKASPRKLSAA